MEEPDKLTSNALSDIYNFVQTEQFEAVQQLTKQFSGKNMKKLQKKMGRMGGLGGMGGGFPGLGF